MNIQDLIAQVEEHRDSSWKLWTLVIRIGWVSFLAATAGVAALAQVELGLATISLGPIFILGWLVRESHVNREHYNLLYNEIIGQYRLLETAS